MVCIAFAAAVFLPAITPVEAGSGEQAQAEAGTTLTAA
jgi:hypothetical protein